MPDLENLANLDTGTTHNAALLHAAPGACFVFVVCGSVGVPVANVGLYVCMVLRVVRAVVCCSVGSRHACELTLNWLGHNDV